MKSSTKATNYVSFSFNAHDLKKCRVELHFKYFKSCSMITSSWSNYANLDAFGEQIKIPEPFNVPVCVNTQRTQSMASSNGKKETKDYLAVVNITLEER
jgi:hypothetical protein